MVRRGPKKPGEISIINPSDMHVHLRDGDLLRRVIRYTAHPFAYATIMPNLKPHVRTKKDAAEYRKRIQGSLPSRVQKTFTPIMTISITDTTTPEIIREACARNGAIAGKVYPAGATTNSESGLSDFENALDVFAEMERVGMILLLHGEIADPEVAFSQREEHFLEILEWLVQEFPKLKIVLEHVSTTKAVQLVSRLGPNVGATITAHHLVLTENDVCGNPYNFCKPVAKTPENQRVLVEAAISGNPKFFFGSDSAPHLQVHKEQFYGVDENGNDCKPAAGIFSAPVALGILAEVFEKQGALDKLQGFVSEFGPRFYGLQLPLNKIRLIREPWSVPLHYAGIIPLRAGKSVAWYAPEDQ